MEKNLSGQRALVQPFAAGQPEQEQGTAGAQLGAHSKPHAHKPEAGSQQHGQREPDAPHAHKVQHKAAGAVTGTLHGTAGHDAGPEHRLGKGFDAQHLRTQRNDGGVGGEDAHQGRSKHIQAHAGQRHDGHAHTGAQPGNAFGHIPPVGAHGLAYHGKGGVLDAVACHVTQAFGAHAQAVGRNGGGAQPGHDAHQQHLSRGKGGSLCRKGRTHPPQIPQAGPGDLPGAGLADAQRALSQQQKAQGAQAANGRSQGGAQSSSRHPPSGTPYRKGASGHHHGTGGVDQKEIENDVQQAGGYADKARGQGVTSGAQHGGVGACGHGKGQGSGPDGKIG